MNPEILTLIESSNIAVADTLRLHASNVATFVREQGLSPEERQRIREGVIELMNTAVTAGFDEQEDE